MNKHWLLKLIFFFRFTMIAKCRDHWHCLKHHHSPTNSSFKKPLKKKTNKQTNKVGYAYSEYAR